MSTDAELSECTGSEDLSEENYNKLELIKVYTRLIKELFSLKNKNKLFLQVLLSKSNLILYTKDIKLLNIDEPSQRKGSKKNYLHKRKKKNCDTKHDDNDDNVGDNVKVLMEYSSVCVLPKSLKLITNDLSETFFSYDLTDTNNLVNKLTLKDPGFKFLM